MTIRNVGHQGGLTPHQDANAKALEALRAKFAELITRPGDAGARARIRLAMIAAYSSAMARERDNGIRMSAIGMGVGDAIADVVASFVVTVAGAAPAAAKVEGVERILATARIRALDAVTTWHEMSADEVTGIRYGITPAARAD